MALSAFWTRASAWAALFLFFLQKRKPNTNTPTATTTTLMALPMIANTINSALGKGGEAEKSEKMVAGAGVAPAEASL